MSSAEEPQKSGLQPEELLRLAQLMPGARVTTKPPTTREGIQEVRNHFRTLERFRTLVKLLTVSTDEMDRVEAVKGLGAFGTRSVSFLIAALENDPSWRVRQRAAASLGLTGDLEALDALRTACEDNELAVQTAAAEAIDILVIMAEVARPDPLGSVHKSAETQQALPNGERVFVEIDLEASLLWTQLLQRGQKRLAMNQLAEAVQDFDEVLAMVDIPQALRSSNYLAVDKVKWAAHRMVCRIAGVHISRGEAHERMGKFELAIVDFTTAIDNLLPLALDGEQEDVRALLALAHQRRGICRRYSEDWIGSEEDVGQAVAFNPVDALSWYNLGTLRLRRSALDDALAAFDQALAIRPNYALAHFNRGAVLSALGKYSDAIIALNTGIAIDSSNAKSFIIRARVHGALGDQIQMQADIERALAINPSLYIEGEAE